MMCETKCIASLMKPTALALKVILRSTRFLQPTSHQLEKLRIYPARKDKFTAKALETEIRATAALSRTVGLELFLKNLSFKSKRTN